MDNKPKVAPSNFSWNVTNADGTMWLTEGPEVTPEVFARMLNDEFPEDAPHRVTRST